MKNEAGFSLISTITALAVFTLVMVGIASMTIESNRNRLSLQASSNYLDLTSELSQTLDSRANLNCTENMRRAIKEAQDSGISVDLLNPNPNRSFPIKKLSVFRAPVIPPGPLPSPYPTPILDRDIAEMGAARNDGLLISDMRVIPRVRIGPRKTLLEVEVHAQKYSHLPGGSAVKPKRFAVFALTDHSGQFAGCGSDGSAAETKMCDVNGAGEFIVDVATGECRPLTKRKCFQGSNASQARCLQGVLKKWTDGCYIENLGQPPDAPNGSYGGNPTTAPVFPYYCREESPTEVTCLPYSLIPLNGNEKCVACCDVPFDTPD